MSATWAYPNLDRCRWRRSFAVRPDCFRGGHFQMKTHSVGAGRYERANTLREAADVVGRAMGPDVSVGATDEMEIL